jgi:nucleotide-binding universal stress UspA family protein
MISNILVAVDNSDCAQHALKFACELAKTAHAHLTLVSVVDVSKLVAIAGYETPYPVDAISIMRDDAKAVLDASAATCRNDGLTASEFQCEGDAVDEILSTAEAQSVDMIVLGTHGRSGLARLFLGSVAEGVLRRSKVPVTVVRG